MAANKNTVVKKHTKKAMVTRKGGRKVVGAEKLKSEDKANAEKS